MNKAAVAPARRTPLFALIAAIALIITACGTEGKVEADPPEKKPTAQSSGEPIMLQRVDGPEVDAFMDSVALTQFTEFPSAVQDAIQTMIGLLDVDDDTGLRTAPGDAPGLYGGSGDDAVCDLDLLADHLIQAEDPTKAEAFAEALGITTEELPEFLAELTPVVLTTDTLVTNHGYRDGRATPFPAVLQAGTAVAVDRDGVPRVKCGCGNPLAPAPTDIAMNDETPTSGEAWADFDPTGVTRTEPAGEPVDDFTLIDTETGETYSRPAGSGDATDDDCYIDPDGHGPDCPDDDGGQDPDIGDDDCYIDPDGHGPDCPDDDGGGSGASPGSTPGSGGGSDDCYIDPDGHGPDCEPGEGLGGPDDLHFFDSWDATAEGLGQYAMFTVECPPNGKIGTVYGSGPYEASSSICSAAVHAGRLDPKRGGTIGGQMTNPGGQLDGSTANGVTSQPSGNPRGAFEIF